jgi:hypothetical protein
LKKSRQISQQGRIDSFFTVLGKTSTVTSAMKRKAEEDKSKKGKKPAVSAKKKKKA